jgi:tRNA(His) 5'-end guanylyltransferase
MSDEKKTVSLGERMKEHEKASRVTLEPRVPVLLRVDGKAFHTYLKSIEAHNPNVNAVMDKVAQELCRTIQGAQLAYVQSDEVSVLIHSYKKSNSSAWYDNQVQKMCSVAAAIASVTFTMESWRIFDVNEHAYSQGDPLLPLCEPAYFDARVFNLPEAEVCNYFIWRQQDAIRNSVAGQARRYFSHKQLENKDQREMKEMLFFKGKPWEGLSIGEQRGRCVTRVVEERAPGVFRSSWSVDVSPPLFVEDRSYVDRHLVVDAEET